MFRIDYHNMIVSVKQQILKHTRKRQANKGMEMDWKKLALFPTTHAQRWEEYR